MEMPSLPHAQHTTTRASPHNRCASSSSSSSSSSDVHLASVVVGGEGGGGATGTGVCVCARACGNREPLPFFSRCAKLGGRVDGWVRDGCSSCGCTGRLVQHQPQMRLDPLSVGTGMYVVVESHRVSRVHLRRGLGGRCPPLSCHLQNRFWGSVGPYFFSQKLSLVGGTSRRRRRACRGVHHEGSFTLKHRCDSTFCRGGTVRARVPSRIGVACHPTTVAGRVVWSRHPLAPPWRTVPSFSALAFSFWQNVLSPLPPAATPRGAVGSGCAETQMRVDFHRGRAV